MNRNYWSIVFIIFGFISALLYVVYNSLLQFYIGLSLKLLPTILMIVWMLIFSKSEKSRIFLIIGFLFSIICDTFMSFSGVASLYYGILSNIIALILYSIFFLNIQNKLNIIRILFPLVILGMFYLLIQNKLGDFSIAVIIYCLIYSIFIWRSLSFIGDRKLRTKFIIISNLGSVVITISDCILALIIFHIIEKSLLISLIIMFLWWTGLMLLLMSSQNVKPKTIK